MAAPLGDSQTLYPLAGERSVDLAQLQLNFLKYHENGTLLSDRERHVLFSTAIIFCACHGEGAEVLDLFREALQKRIFANNKEHFAKVISNACCKLIEKGFHHKAFQLYKDALDSDIWTGHIWQQNTARMKLLQVGYHL
jgi:hypothetical protein